MRLNKKLNLYLFLVDYKICLVYSLFRYTSSTTQLIDDLLLEWTLTEINQHELINNLYENDKNLP